MRWKPFTIGILLGSIVYLLGAWMFAAPSAEAHLKNVNCYSIARVHTINHGGTFRHAKGHERWCKKHQRRHRSVVVAQGWASASWYGPCCYTNTTANGTYYTQRTWGVAHRSLPFGTRCTFWHNGRVAYNVPVNDRGPFVSGRTWDLSAAVASHLNFGGVHTIKYRCTRSA